MTPEMIIVHNNYDNSLNSDNSSSLKSIVVVIGFRHARGTCSRINSTHIISAIPTSRERMIFYSLFDVEILMMTTFQSKHQASEIVRLKQNKNLLSHINFCS